MNYHPVSFLKHRYFNKVELVNKTKCKKKYFGIWIEDILNKNLELFFFKNEQDIFQTEGNDVNRFVPPRKVNFYNLVTTVSLK